jgi:hypothetical protein
MSMEELLVACKFLYLACNIEFFYNDVILQRCVALVNAEAIGGKYNKTISST